MRAMVLEAPGTPLKLKDIPVPRPGPHQVLVRVHACAVCRTDLHHGSHDFVAGHQRERKPV